jgi:hypothetical protein
MPLRVDIDIGRRPDLNADALLPIFRQGLDYEVLKPGRFQVPDVIVKRSDSDGAAIQILQQRLRHRTRLRVYPIAPSISKRRGTPLGIARQMRRSQPLVDEVVAFIRSSDALSQRNRAGS